MKTLWFAAAVATLFVSNAAFANTRICVTVQQKSWYKAVAPRAAPPPPPPAPAPEAEGPSVTVPATPPAPPPPARPRDTDPYGGPAPSQQQWGVPLVGPPPPPSEVVVTRARIPQNPHEIDPTQHLRRLLEYEVTHEPGFAAVTDACQQRLTVELYQLES